jgi:glycosyltransferase involved in cell wall biosynthesis
MKICLYTETAIPMLGGQALVVDALARQFHGMGHEAVVLAPRQRHAGTLDESSLPYRMARHPRVFSTRWFVTWYGRWLEKLHREHQFDVVHCHSTYINGYVAASCRALENMPLIITSHGSDLDPMSLLSRKPQLRGRYLAALRRADAVVAVSRFVEERFRTLYPSLRRVERIPNGVDLARFTTEALRPATLNPAIQSGEYLLYMGRLDPRKGVDLLLDAFRLAADEKRIALVVAGTGSDEESLRGLAAGLTPGKRIHFLGRVDGDAKTWLLANALCNIIPSRVSEAFPLALLESYAAGRPVIGTRIPGLEDLINHGCTGMLVRPDSAAALAEALKAAIGNRQWLDAMGQEARRAARDYDWSRVARRYLELFDDLIKRHHVKKAA